MGKETIYSICFILLVSCVGGCRKTQPALPDLREKYLYTDTKPFGTFVAHALVDNIYDDKFIQKTNRSFAKEFTSVEDTASLYFSISRNFLPDEKDVYALLDYVNHGNTAFISASLIDTVLLGKMYCNQVNYDWLFRLNAASYRNTSVRLIKAATTLKDSFSYFYYPFANHFSSINNADCRIVGYNEDDKPNWLVFFWGKGRLYLHSDPRAFSNYFLLTNNNVGYLKQVLQLLPQKPEHVYWDNYYNRINYKSTSKKSFSSLRAIFDHPSLTTAFWISLVLLGLYVLFNSKRHQRIIPVIKPVENTTIAFAQAIAGLYLQEKNNKSIADKMITYFNEHVRSRYFLNTTTTNNDFIAALSRKSGVPLDKTESLYNAIQHANNTDEIDDYQLLSLNEQIQQFHKNRN